jgi:hypothetical protein
LWWGLENKYYIDLNLRLHNCNFNLFHLRY